MSHNQSQSPVKLIVSDSFYEILLHRRAQDNERLAAQGLAPRTDELWCISESDAAGLAADQANRGASQPAQNGTLAPPPPTRGRLCRAAKTKVFERNASISGFHRHSRKCQICRSPYVDLIEQVYLQWERVDNICRYFQLADTDTLYRHARAAGLDVLRRQNSRWVVEQFIEQWRTVKISSATVIRSIRALSCLDEQGRWTDLPKTHIFVRANEMPQDSVADSPTALRSPYAQEARNVPFSTEQREPSFSGRSSQPHEDDVSLSFERSEPYSGRGSVRSSQPREDVPFPSERSEQRHGRDSGLPAKIVTSGTDLSEMEPAVLLPPSTERSEPQKNSSANSSASRRASSARQEDVPFSFERSEPFAEGKS